VIVWFCVYLLFVYVYRCSYPKSVPGNPKSSVPGNPKSVPGNGVSFGYGVSVSYYSPEYVPVQSGTLTRLDNHCFGCNNWPTTTVLFSTPKFRCLFDVPSPSLQQRTNAALIQRTPLSSTIVVNSYVWYMRNDGRWAPPSQTFIRILFFRINTHCYHSHSDLYHFLFNNGRPQPPTFSFDLFDSGATNTRRQHWFLSQTLSAIIQWPNAARYHSYLTAVDLLCPHSFQLDTLNQHTTSYKQTSAALTNDSCRYLPIRLPNTTSLNCSHFYLILTMEPTMEPLPITAFIDCSPLGLYCRDCMVAFSSNDSARKHVKLNHWESINTMKPEVVRETFKELRERSGDNS